MGHTHTNEQSYDPKKSYWQTITIAPVKDRKGKDDPKYYITDVNNDEYSTVPIHLPSYFNHRVDLLLFAFGLLGFCVYPKQIWFEVKAKFS